MKELADGVWHIKCLPGLPWAVNAYRAGDVLIDAGCRQSTGRILKQLDRHDVKAHALTHAHPDHQGASHAICERLGIPLWCGEGDVEAMETGTVGFDIADHWTKTLQRRFWTGPAHKVDRVLRASTRALTTRLPNSVIWLFGIFSASSRSRSVDGFHSTDAACTS